MNKLLKKAVLLFLSSIMIFTCYIAKFPKTVLANEETNHEALYFATEENLEATEIAQTHLDSYLQYLKNIGELDSAENLSLGIGIRILNPSEDNQFNPAFVFPIFENSKIKLLLRVYDTGNSNHDYTSILSSGNVDKFNNLFSEFNNQTISLIYSNKNLLAISPKKTFVISESPQGSPWLQDDINLSLNYINNTTSINVLRDIGYNTFTPRISFRNHYLKIDYLEKQTSLPWCAAYATANILRYLTGQKIYASTIMNHFGLSSNDSLSHSQITSYALTKSFSATYNGIKINSSILESSIAAGRPVYFSMKTPRGYHAIVAHGTQQGSDIVHVRNPWYQFSELYHYDSNSYVSVDGERMSMRGYILFKPR